MRAVVGCPDPGSESSATPQRHSIAYVRPRAILPSLAFAGLAFDLPGPKTRAAIFKQLHGRAEDVDAKRIPADPIRDHVLSTVSPARQGRAFRLIGRGSSRAGKWNSSTSMAKFFFKNPSFDCIVTSGLVE